MITGAKLTERLLKRRKFLGRSVHARPSDDFFSLNGLQIRVCVSTVQLVRIKKSWFGFDFFCSRSLIREKHQM